MRWTDSRRAGKRPGLSGLTERFAPALALFILLLWPPAQQAQPSSAQERLSVYAPRGSFSVPIQSLAGRDYIPLLDLLGPLGDVDARQDDRKWKVRFNGTDLEFQDGKTRAKVGGKSLDLPSAFNFQDARGMVPLAGTVALLSPLLRQPVELHESARRLFIGGVAIHFTAQVAHSPADAVVLNFSAPVNPSIATEPGRLRMTFVHEPLLHPSPSTLAFEDKYFSSLTYHEGEGVAELTLNSSVPLLARFSPDRKTITLAPVVQIVAQAKPQPTSAAPAPAPSPAASPVPPSAAPGRQSAPAAGPPTPTALPPLVVLDASHGGAETGAALGENLIEKDVTLSIALRLHNDLEARGLRTLLLRSSDTALTLEQRAVLANTSRARFYISIHAGSLSGGVRLYTALLPPITPASGPFLPWDSAQATFLSSSLALSANIAAELGKISLSSRQMPAPVSPLNHIASAAVAVEVGPSGADVVQLNSPAYQEQVASAIAAGVARSQQGVTP
ncbi:MAG TPA: N-acetylmuramoyl-L-alanine amidase [Terriglobales bacterium]|nr:N-acetylmuramoyl-L-alanine amidase [Terriglobales bacterium]